MKKRVVSLAVVLLLLLSLSAQAATRAIQTNPKLSFIKTTAYCTVDVQGGNTKDTIEVTMTLWYGKEEVESWNDSGIGDLYISKTCAVDKGKTYKLTVDVKINGSALPQKSVTATC